jgi:hypothetical protein
MIPAAKRIVQKTRQKADREIPVPTQAVPAARETIIQTAIPILQTV